MMDWSYIPNNGLRFRKGRKVLMFYFLVFLRFPAVLFQWS